MTIPLLSVLVAATSWLCISGYYQQNKLWVYLFKPLTTVLIMIIAGLANTGESSTYQTLIITALVFCLMGDVFLMLEDKFLQGLGSFFVAQLLFSAAFYGADNSTTPWLIALLAGAGISIYGFLYPFLGKMKFPVLAYFVVILLMTWCAWERLITQNTTTTLLAAIATVIFMASDLTIALDKFRKSFKSAQAIILSTYFLAIWLIAISPIFRS